MSEPADRSSIPPGRQFVIFTLGKEEYAAPVLSVAEVVPMLELTQFPDAPDYVLGLVNLRGSILPLLDLARKFELNPGSPAQEHIMIIEDDEKSRYGLLVDQVIEVLKVPAGNVKPSPHIPHKILQPTDLAGVIVLSDRSGIASNARIVPILNMQSITSDIPLDRQKTSTWVSKKPHRNQKEPQ